MTSVSSISASAASVSTQKSQPQSTVVSASASTSASSSADSSPQPAALFPTVMLESAHAYGAHVSQSAHIRIPGASHVLVEFDRRCCTERGRDFLEVKATSPVPASASVPGSASGSGAGSSLSALGSAGSAVSPSASVAGSQPLSLHGSARHWPRAPIVFAGDSVSFLFRSGDVAAAAVAAGHDVGASMWGFRVFCTGLPLHSDAATASASATAAAAARHYEHQISKMATSAALALGRCARVSYLGAGLSVDNNAIETRHAAIVAAPFLSAPLSASTSDLSAVVCAASRRVVAAKVVSAGTLAWTLEAPGAWRFAAGDNPPSLFETNTQANTLSPSSIESPFSPSFSEHLTGPMSWPASPQHASSPRDASSNSAASEPRLFGQWSRPQLPSWMRSILHVFPDSFKAAFDLTKVDAVAASNESDEKDEKEQKEEVEVKSTPASSTLAASGASYPVDAFLARLIDAPLNSSSLSAKLHEHICRKLPYSATDMLGGETVKLTVRAFVALLLRQAALESVCASFAHHVFEVELARAAEAAAARARFKAATQMGGDATAEVDDGDDEDADDDDDDSETDTTEADDHEAPAAGLLRTDLARPESIQWTAGKVAHFTSVLVKLWKEGQKVHDMNFVLQLIPKEMVVFKFRSFEMCVRVCDYSRSCMPPLPNSAPPAKNSSTRWNNTLHPFVLCN